MDQLDTSGGIDTLVQRTTDIIESTVNPSTYKYDSKKKYRTDQYHLVFLSDSINRRHLEYLPYPDWNFVEEVDETNQGIIGNI